MPEFLILISGRYGRFLLLRHSFLQLIQMATNAARTSAERLAHVAIT